MGIPGSANLLLAAAAAESYQIEQSLFWNGQGYSSALSLRRTQGTGTSNKICTFSTWQKKCISEGNAFIFWGTASNQTGALQFVGGQKAQLSTNLGESGYNQSVALFRDDTAWYHYVYQIDTTQATNTNRFKCWVNGVQVTQWSPTFYPAQDSTWLFGSAVQVNLNSAYNSSGQFSSAEEHYVAETHFIDGTAYEPTDFGEYDENGVWRPIEVTGLSYGNNGFYLTYDSSATNGVGHDHSGNGNNFTLTDTGNNTAVVNDTPTTNYATINPLGNISGLSGTVSTIEEGNLKQNSNGNTTLPTTIAIPAGVGKWYWEAEPNVVQASSNFVWGVQRADVNPADYTTWSNVRSRGVFINTDNQNQIWEYGSTSTSTAWTVAAGDILGFALDASNGNLAYYKNGVLQDTLSGAVNTSYPHYPAASGYQGVDAFTWNFGQRELAYPPGTSSATDYFNTLTYAGNSGTQSVTGCGFQPDLVYVKNRTQGASYGLFDVVRGVSLVLQSDTTTAEQNYGSNGVTSFDSDGFTVVDSGGYGVNQSGSNFVAWCWKAGGTASSNTDGTITASVSANQTSGFSIATYTGTGSNASFGHGLGATPTFCIVKNRDTTQSWWVWHKDFGNNDDANNSMIELNGSGTKYASDDVFRGLTSTVVKIGTDTGSNASGDDYVAYTWTDKDGVTKTGSYTGNGSDPGDISVSCGFKPAMVIVKGDASASWQIIDSERGEDTALFPDSSSAENSRSDRKILLTQSGFIVQGNDGNINSNNVTYYFIAFAENYSADTDYKELNTKNLPAPDLADGSAHFNTVAYTGNGSTQSITGVGFQPDWTWIKIRSQAGDHVLQDAVRGTFRYLLSNSTQAENTSSTLDFFRSFDSDGFSVAYTATNGANYNETNLNSATYVAWNWKAGGSTSSNTAGQVTSTVSANPSAGFSVVTFTGATYTGVYADDTRTVGHGLGVAPSFYVVKSTSASSAWVAYHSALGNGKYIELDSNGGQTTNSRIWENTSPTSTVFTMGSFWPSNIVDGEDLVAYCFAEVEGYSKVGSYTGNGSTDGPIVYCGFRPAWVLTKRTDSTGEWYITDTTRSAYNLELATLFPNLNNAETTDGGLDFLSNGFKLRNVDGSDNASGGSYIFIAFAENPFGGDGVSPATAR